MPPALPAPDPNSAQGRANQPMSPASQRAAWTDLLACPACRSGLNESAAELTCRACGRRYPIKDGIPLLLLEDAILPTKAPGRTADDQRTGQPGKN